MRLFRSISHISARYWLYSFIALIISGQFSAQSFGFNMNKYLRFKHGAVYSRGIIEGGNGQPIYVVYDEQGEEVREIGEVYGQYEGSRVMSGDTFRAYIQQLSEFKNLNGDGIAKDAELVSRSTYEGSSFVYSSGETIQKRTLRLDTQVVLIRAESQRTLGLPEPLVLLEFPVDLIANPSLSETVTSIIVSEDGVIMEQAQAGENIGYKVGFFGDEGESFTLRRRFDDKIHSPIPGVFLEVGAGVYIGGIGVTNEEGKYSMQYYLPPCPGFAFEHDTTVWTELYYANFNPRGAPIIPYFLRRQDWTWCIDYASSPVFLTGGLLGLAAQANVAAIEASIATPVYNVDFPVEVVMLTGYALFANIYAGGGIIPFSSESRFQVELPDLTPIVQNNYDFDGDGSPDSALLGRIEEQTNAEGETLEVFVPDEQGELQGVYLSSIAREEGNPPDLIRLADTAPDFRHQGLLEEISEADLQKTDLYVFRKSNGQLIIEREGLDQDELPFVAQTGVNDEQEALFYKLLIRGPGDWARFGDRGPFTEWQSTSILDESLHERESDNLRAGEEVQIVMINRATGYIGTTTTTLQSAGSDGSPNIAVYVNTIAMQPPNLKIYARRTYDVKAGATAGEERTFQLGFEGSALTNDRYVEIITEWYNHDGSPLPEALGDYGYTGRVAKVVAPNQLGNSLSEFSIRPGTHLEVLKLPGTDLGTEHFYIHVNGERKDGGNPNFGSVGQNEGVLQYRPNRYVPFLVQMYDEASSIFSQQAYRYAKWQNPELDLPEPEGVYHWVYRPEYQFSVFELEVDKLRQQLEKDALGVREIDPRDYINVLDVHYSLFANTDAPLDPFGAERELILGAGGFMGGGEAEATIGDSQIARISNAGLLSGLAQITPGDWLTLRLYQNTDVANTLYEYQPFLLANASKVSLNKTTQVALFNPGLGSQDTNEVTQTFRRIQFKLLEPAKVKVDILDHEKQRVGTLLSKQDLPAGDHNFVVLYEDIEGTAISKRIGTDFYIQMTAEQVGVSGPTLEVLYPGDFKDYIDGDMLGNVILHDVLIQRGELNFQRGDVKLKGRGPQLDFARTYTSASRQRANEYNPMGTGWRHNHDITLSIVGYGDIGTEENLPQWVLDNQGKFFPNDAVDNTVQPKLISIVGGGLFKRTEGGWVPSRGNHGTLEYNNRGTTDDNSDDVYEYRSKDGTLYVFSAISGKRKLHPVQYIEDRNGNRLTYDYEAVPGSENRDVVKKVTDEVGRTMDFTYRSLGGQTRLTKVTLLTGSQDEITLDFEYTRSSTDENQEASYLLSEYQRADFVETYAYEKEAPVAGFEPLYNITEITDGNGHKMRYSYTPDDVAAGDKLKTGEPLNPEDMVKEVIYPDGSSAVFAYDIDGNIRTVADLRGNDTVYTLNDIGNPVTIKEPLGKTSDMTWTIDEGKVDNLMTSMTDALNRTIAHDYDAKGNVIRREDALGNADISTWNQQYSLPLTQKDRNGNTTTYVYDSNGNLTKQTDPESFAVVHAYNASGERTSTKDPRGNTTTYSYDSYGNIAQISEPSGSVTKFVNDARGRMTQKTDPNGNVYKYAYDDLDRLISMEDPDGFTETYTYDSVGNKLSETSKLGLKLTYTYDKRDRVTKVTRSLGGAKSYTYDSNSNMLTETDWKGQTTSYTYDALNRETSMRDRLGQSTSKTYDLANNVLSQKDEAGRTAQFTYDDLDRLVNVKNPLGDSMSTTYDKIDNVLTETDYAGRVTTHQYDDRYLKTRTTDALGGITAVIYDGNGNITQMTDEEGRVTKYEYDKQNRKIGEVDALGFSTSYVYDANGNVTQMTDRRGNVTAFTYDALNRPVEETDGEGFVTAHTYDANGNKLSTEIPEGGVYTYTYDALNRVLTETNAIGATTTRVYDFNDNVTSFTDPRGMITGYVFDALDRLTSETQDDSRTLTYAYDAVGNVTSETDFRGNATTKTYDKLNRVTSVKDALGEVTSYQYDAVNNLTRTTDRRGNATVTVYDKLNRPTSITDALGQAMTMTYDAVDNVLTETDRRGTVTTHAYDKLNRLLSSTKSSGASLVRLVLNAYDGEGNIVKITDANDNVESYTFDGRNLRTQITRPDDTTVSIVYDDNGNVVTETDEVGETMTYAYDAHNRLISETNHAEETVSYKYDLNDNRTQVTKPLGNSVVSVYDPFNRVLSIKDSLGGTTRYTYDGNDNLVAQVDANGNVVNYAYDALNRVTTHTQVKATGNLVTAYGYDPEGNQISSTDAKGQTFSTQYDAINRVILRTFPTAATSFYSPVKCAYSYDPNNNLTQVVESKIDELGQSFTDTCTKTYDLLDRITQSVERGHTINFVYDDNGNRLSVSSPGGTTTYTYDSRNRLLTATQDSQTTTYTYRGDNLATGVAYPNGTGAIYGYDSAKRKNSVVNTDASSGVISSFLYTYDQNSNRLSQEEFQPSLARTNVTTTYTYDANDRMTGYVETDTDTGESIEYAYSYDATFNRTYESKKVNGTVTTESTYQYDETHWLSEIQYDADPDKKVEYTYDANGNTLLTTDYTKADIEVTEFDYDSRNQLVQLTRGPPTGQTLQGRFDYDYRGMRVRHFDSSRGDVNYYYDESAILDEYSADTNTLLAHYNYADKLISLKTPTDTQFYHYSALRTTANLTDAFGAVKVSYNTDPWGRITEESGASVNRHVFTGQEHDQNTGLVYFGARYYDPKTARFITQDTYLGESGTPPSLHRYLYAYSNPTVYIDPNGNLALKFVQDWLNRTGDEAINTSAQLLKSDSWFDKGLGVISGLSGGITKGVGFVAGVGNYVENQAILAVESTAMGLTGSGILPESSVEAAAMQTAETYDAIGATAEALSTQEGRAAIGEAFVEHGKKVLAGDTQAIAGTLGFLGEFMVPSAGALSKAKFLKGAKTGTQITKQAVTKQRVLANIAKSKAARESSSFGKHAMRERVMRNIAKSKAAREASNFGKATNRGDDLVLDAYGKLKNNSNIPGQAHHLNQDAAFKSVIPTKDGISVKLEGNAFTEIGTPHYSAHANLEGFWNQFRRGGGRAGEIPTNLEYSKALADSLRAAGLNPNQVRQALKASIHQRVNAGQLGGLEIPRVPGRINQVKP